jgi:type 1 fimbriae regulatory protein FimE
MAAKSNVVALRGSRPTIKNGNVSPPARQKNVDRRSREHLTPGEVAKLMKTAGAIGRHGHRDATLLLIAYRHGLRVSEVTSLRWDQVDLKQGLMNVNRVKNGLLSTHPIRGPELRALRRLQKEYGGPYVCSTERLGPMTTATVRKLMARAGEKAKLPFQVHPHMLRHACGYKFANEGHDNRALQHYLGHKNIEHTVRYTELALDRFKNFWRD